jgi:hypothetical protein
MARDTRKKNGGKKVHIRLRWDDPMPHAASDYEEAKDLPVAGKPARQG